MQEDDLGLRHVRKCVVHLVRDGRVAVAVALAGQDAQARVAVLHELVRCKRWGLVRTVRGVWGLDGGVIDGDDGTFLLPNTVWTVPFQAVDVGHDDWSSVVAASGTPSVGAHVFWVDSPAALWAMGWVASCTGGQGSTTDPTASHAGLAVALCWPIAGLGLHVCGVGDTVVCDLGAGQVFK